MKQTVTKELIRPENRKHCLVYLFRYYTTNIYHLVKEIKNKMMKTEFPTRPEKNNILRNSILGVKSFQSDKSEGDTFISISKF